MAFVKSLFNLKTIGILALLGGIFYYGWPVLEALMSIVPVNFLGSINLDGVKSAAGSATGFVSGAMSSSNQQQKPMGYSQDLENQPDAFLAEEDDSDDDVGKT